MLFAVRLLVPPLFFHVVLESGVDAIEVSEIAVVLSGVGELLLADRPKQLHRVVIDRVPKIAIKPAEEFHRIVVPHPPQVVRQLEQRLKRFGHVRENLERADVRSRKNGHGNALVAF